MADEIKTKTKTVINMITGSISGRILKTRRRKLRKFPR